MKFWKKVRPEEHDQAFHTYMDAHEGIGEELADYVISGIRTPEEMITFCINKGLKPEHAHDLVKQFLKNLGINDL